MKLCNWCDTRFEPTVSYQIYCSTDCRTQATKEKIVERHKILKRKKREGKVRNCVQCGTSLSVFNDEPLCYNCEINHRQVTKVLKELKKLGLMDYEDNT